MEGSEISTGIDTGAARTAAQPLNTERREIEVRNLLGCSAHVVTGLVAAESRGYKKEDQFKGIRPQGETIATLRALFEKAPLYLREDGTTRTIDLTGVNSSAMKNGAEAQDLFFITPEGDLDLSIGRLAKAYDQYPEIRDQMMRLGNLNADRLLLALWTAGASSPPDRMSSGLRPTNLEAKYYHPNNEQASIIKVDTFTANALCTVCEDAIIQHRGTI